MNQHSLYSLYSNIQILQELSYQKYINQQIMNYYKLVTQIFINFSQLTHYIGQVTMMKNIYVPFIKEVPEWRECYYDYQPLKKLVDLVQQINQQKKYIQKSIQAYLRIHHNHKKHASKIVILTRIQFLSRCQFRLNQIIQQTNKTFYQYSYNSIEKLYFFVQYKCFEIKQKVDRLLEYSKLVDRDDQDLNSLIQNAYIEVYYLKRMIQYNLAQQSMVIRDYQLNLFSYQSLYEDEPYSRRMDRIKRFVSRMAEKLQKTYMIKSSEVQTYAMNQLLSYGSTNLKSSKVDIFQLGFTMGILLVVFAAVIFFKQYNDITLESNKQYASDFPIWRGASAFVFYQWILGFVFMFLQRTQINYKMILSLESQTVPKSRTLFFGAQITTIIFLILFCLYMLEMSHVINTGFRYFGHIMWLVLIVYYLIPIPFTNYQGKIYFLKLLLLVLLSPVWKINPLIIWLSQQIVSFIQPFSDLSYTICKLNNYDSKCSQITDVSFIIIVTIFSWRVVQNFKMFYLSGWRFIPPFYGIWRALAALITAIFSWYYRKDLAKGWFIIWIIAASISSSIAVFADFKGDWGLLSGSILRKKLIFANVPYFYYIVMFVDAILRCNWALNLSPNIVNNLGILPYYLIMIVSYLELFRRGMWNILRIQFDHAVNCQKFQATINDSIIENRLKQNHAQQLDRLKKPQSSGEEANLRKKAQYQLVIQNVRNQQSDKQRINKFIKEQRQKLKQIQASLHN